jgi:hypothetical protein
MRLDQDQKLLKSEKYNAIMSGGMPAPIAFVLIIHPIKNFSLSRRAALGAAGTMILGALLEVPTLSDIPCGDDREHPDHYHPVQ